MMNYCILQSSPQNSWTRPQSCSDIAKMIIAKFTPNTFSGMITISLFILVMLLVGNSCKNVCDRIGTLALVIGQRQKLHCDGPINLTIEHGGLKQ
jgi:hypothetical protein